jgi:predicted nuclease of predicted toxin-antitoxin system
MTGNSGRSSILLYTDEDVTDRLAVLLQRRGYEAVSVGAAGTKGLPDEEQLAFAAERRWTILTYNRKDFVLLARRWFAAGREHAGIVLSRQFSNDATGELLRQVCRLIETVSAEEMWNTVRDLQSYR